MKCARIMSVSIHGISHPVLFLVEKELRTHVWQFFLTFFQFINANLCFQQVFEMEFLRTKKNKKQFLYLLVLVMDYADVPIVETVASVFGFDGD